MRNISITLTPYLKDWVEARVQSGRYSDVSDVMCEALRLLGQHELERTARLRDVRVAATPGQAATYGSLGALLEAPVR
jgi:antitoxin ParD1/3/4